MALIPFDDRDGTIWFDGKLIPWRDAKVHVLTHGLHYASVVFEGERAYSGHVFHTSEHSQRLHNSAKILGFEIPWSVAALDQAKADTIAPNKSADGYVRPIAWRGSERIGRSAQPTNIHL